MKKRLQLTSKETKGIHTIEQYANALWKKFSVDISTDSSKNPVSKKTFEQYLRIYYEEAKADNPKLTPKKAMKVAAKSYEMSAMYFTYEERVASFSIKDFIQSEERKDISRFQHLTREKGKFSRFDPTQAKYLGTYELGEEVYTLYRYKDVIRVSLNSPEEVYFAGINEITASKVAKYVNGINLDTGEEER